MKQVNIKKQKIVLLGYFRILETCLSSDKSYHFTKKELYHTIFDSILEKNTQNMWEDKSILIIVGNKLTLEQVNKGVYICQQIVQDVDYANNLFALSKKYRGLL
jgi:Fe-S cluster biosynthesis and repair protein YggX